MADKKEQPTEEYPHPTPTQAELNAIKRGETGVTDTDPTEDEDEGEDGKAKVKSTEASRPAVYQTRQSKAD